MQVTFKLYAALSNYLPEGAEKHRIQINIDPATTVNEIIDSYNIPRAMAHLVLINGIYLNPDKRDDAVLTDGDTLAIWPPVAGG